jgi:hypothetical protein
MAETVRQIDYLYRLVPNTSAKAPKQCGLRKLRHK